MPLSCRHTLLLLVACLVLGPVHAADNGWKGQKLADFLHWLSADGVRVIFSSDLVLEQYRLREEPDLADIEAALPGLLAPFGLGIENGPGGTRLVVRLPEASRVSADAEAVTPEPPLPEIIVTSSLQRLERVHLGAHTYFDRELAARVPTTAEEVIRLTNQLPGTAGSGLSARNHIRGGETNEVLYLLDGIRLYEPFHLKDFQSIATIVNSNVIEGIDVYTGAFPARFGDRMSGVMTLDLREPRKRRETELGLSFFNASALSLGTFGDGERGSWLVSARRGNLDLVVDVVDPEYGKPRYSDLFLHSGWAFGPKAELSAGFLASTDKIRLSDSDRGETARARYSNEIFWVKWSASWNDSLDSETRAAYTSIDNHRLGAVELPGIVSGTLDDTKQFRIGSLRQDWTLNRSDRWLWTFGFEARHVDGDFEHAAARALTPPFDDLFAGAGTTERTTAVSADGSQFALYAEARWQIRSGVFLEPGVRWDRQNYTVGKRDDQTSPRLSALVQLGDMTDLRLGIGRFYQAQEVNELQVSDGVSEYFPAQRAQHVVVSLQHAFSNGTVMDLSVYRKRFDRLRPRYENVFNPLSILPEIQFDRVRIEPREAESRGAELMFSQESEDRDLVWWIGYTWALSEDRTAAGGLKRSWDQTHTGKAGISWLWRDWSISATTRIHTGWPRTTLSQLPGDDQGGSPMFGLDASPLYEARYRTFHTLDARVSRDIPLARGHLTVFLDVTNLLDRPNPCCTEYSLDNANGEPALQSRQARWLPILPSLGVIWKF